MFLPPLIPFLYVPFGTNYTTPVTWSFVILRTPAKTTWFLETLKYFVSIWPQVSLSLLGRVIKNLFQSFMVTMLYVQNPIIKPIQGFMLFLRFYFYFSPKLTSASI